MGTLIDYWHFTGDDHYNELVQQAIVHQAGEDEDLMPKNQTRTMGNDDQGFWGMTAMSAAEYVFPNPPEDKPQWLALVQAIFNEFTARWDKEHCNGGLRWQVFNFNVGWDYKNSISNGCFFNIAARLARYTSNNTYAEWANTIWDWEKDIGLITQEWALKDGVTIHEGQPCSEDMDGTEWSYNSGIWLHGSAVMFNYTGDQIWKRRVEGILRYGTTKFANNDIVLEQFCEPHNICDDDQRSFKGYYLRWLAAVAVLVPELNATIYPLLRSTAEAAAASCSGSPTKPISKYPMFNGHPGTACGFGWLHEGGYDGQFGVPEQMNGVAAFISVLGGDPPVSADTGGTSKGNPLAGGSDENKIRPFTPITVGDQVGAGFLTTLALAGIIGGTIFVAT